MERTPAPPRGTEGDRGPWGQDARASPAGTRRCLEGAWGGHRTVSSVTGTPWARARSARSEPREAETRQGGARTGTEGGGRGQERQGPSDTGRRRRSVAPTHQLRQTVRPGGVLPTGDPCTRRDAVGRRANGRERRPTSASGKSYVNVRRGDLRTERVIRGTEGHRVMIQRAILREDTSLDACERQTTGGKRWQSCGEEGRGHSWSLRRPSWKRAARQMERQ